ncbi:MAG: hypothetical protein K0Q68_1120 [Moraxellaceae bacterium]|jgi:translocation and assembly module TamB|nr:hypothetical protein [Moraxellaceae bacterium]
MWRHHARRAGRHLWRLLLGSLVLALVLAGALLAALGSETGSRWLLEQGLGMQRGLEARYQGGTLLGGLELTDVRFHSAKTDLRVNHLLARWSLWGLLRGGVDLKRLELEGVELRRLAPPSPDKTDLPTILLPVRLNLAKGQARDIRYWPWGAAEPYTLRTLDLSQADWRGTRIRFGQLVMVNDRIGRLVLGGRIRLRGGYPLEVKGLLDYPPFRPQGWNPVEVGLSREVADLDFRLRLKGKVTATAHGRLQPLEKNLPYQAFLQWQAVDWPWWSDQSLRSEGGHLKVQGDRHGLLGQGEAQLASRQLPTGRYTLKGQTDWRSAKIDYLNFKGLGGNARVAGEVGWGKGLSWKLSSRLDGIDLAQKWKVSRLMAPVLTGELLSSGKTSVGGSDLTASLRLAGGESWEVKQSADSWAWNLDAGHRVSARWSGVSRRLENGRTIYGDSGRVEASGTRAAYAAQVEASMVGEGLPRGQWTASLRGSERQVGIDMLRYQGEAGALSFQGDIAIASPLRWSGRLDLDQFSTGWLLPEWSGQFSGQVTGTGAWSDTRRSFHLEQMLLGGIMREQPVTLEGPLDVQLAPGAWPALYSPGLDLRWGRNQAMFIGGLQDGNWDLVSDLDLADLALLEPSLRGALKGQLDLQGRERRPDIQARLTATELRRGGLGARAVQLDARIVALGDGASQIRLVADGMTSADGREEWGRGTLDLAGSRDSHRLDWQLEGDRLLGQGRLAGGQAATGWSGRMESGQLAVAGLEWRLAVPYAMAWERAVPQVWLAPHCWVSGEASLCNQEEMRLGRAGHVRMALSGLALERIRGIWPEGLEMAGQLAGQVVGDWKPGQAPLVKGSLEATAGEVRLLREEGLPPVVRGFDRIAVTAEAGLRSVDLRFDLVSPDMGQGQAQVRLDPYAEGKPLAGELSLQGLRLGIFQPFFPGLSALAGKLSAEGRLSGLLARPYFAGQVRIEEGELAFQRLPLHVRDLETRIDVNGTSAEITGEMKSGPGGATLTGSADWSGEPRLELRLKGERFQLSQPPELIAEVDPDLLLRVVPRRVDLTGTLRVPSGRLNLKRLTAVAVPLSPDIRIVHPDDREGLQVAGQVEDWSINADVRLRLGDDVYFQGYGVTGRLEGGLRLRQEGRRGLEAGGEVQLDKEARYDAYGQRLQIRRGRLIFAGNLSQPGLDVEAIRTVDDKVVGVRVEGRANQPEATLFSDSPMSQEEIVSYLVLGRPLDTQGRPESAGNLTAAAAAIKLGATGAGGVGLTSRVGETLGISDLSVDAEGRGDDTQFTVSGYISPKLYLRYGVGIFTPVNTATLRYKINARLYLEAVSSLESAIDLFYNMRF